MRTQIIRARLAGVCGWRYYRASQSGSSLWYVKPSMATRFLSEKSAQAKCDELDKEPGVYDSEFFTYHKAPPQMKLYILRPIPDDELWAPWHDKAFGFVVAAESEEQARALAQAEGGDEVSWDKQHPAWTDPQHSTCAEMIAGDTPGVIMRDFRAA